MAATTLIEINKQLQIPEEDSSTPVKESEAKFIYDFITSKKLGKTLETGFAYGRSASHIIAATNSIHIAIDPFQDRYHNVGLHNIEKLGFNNLLDFRKDFSHNVLPELLKQNRKFDFIFIDGDHKFDGILVDFYYSDLLLEEGGYILLHDTWMRSTQLVMGFIKTNRKDFKKIDTGLRNLALFQKTGKDERNGMFFREFYNSKRLFIHFAIQYMSSGSKNKIKKGLLWLKEKVK